MTAKRVNVRQERYLEENVMSLFQIKNASMPSKTFMFILERCFGFQGFWAELNFRGLAEPEWPIGIERCARRTDDRWFEPWPKPPPMLVDTSTSTWIKKAWLPCDAMPCPMQCALVTPEVNLRITQTRKHAKGSSLALKPRVDITRSPQWGISDPMKRTYVLQNIFKRTFWGLKFRNLCCTCRMSPEQ